MMCKSSARDLGICTIPNEKTTLGNQRIFSDSTKLGIAFVMDSLVLLPFAELILILNLDGNHETK